MKIMFDASSMVRKPTGVGFYSKDLLEHMVKLDTKNYYDLFAFLFFTQKPFSEPLKEYPNIRYQYVRYLPGRVYNLLLLLGLAPPVDLMLFQKPDLVICPNFIRYPLASHTKSITVIHDLCYLLHPDLIERNRFAEFLKREVPKSLKKSTHVVAVSENTKQDIIKNYHIEASKISVISPSVDHAIFKPASKAEIEKIKKKYGIKDSYLLFLGSLDPRKNVVGVLEAYLALPKELQGKYQLVLAGGKGLWDYPEREKLLQRIPKDRLVLTGYFNEIDKPTLYSGATLLVYPSHFEGWGMQILEAMACGTPVLTARNSALPESGGEAVYYVEDSHNTIEITQGLEKLLASPKELEKLGEKGLVRSQKFSWEKSAEKMLKLIESI